MRENIFLEGNISKRKIVGPTRFECDGQCNFGMYDPKCTHCVKLSKYSDVKHGNQINKNS